MTGLRSAWMGDNVRDDWLMIVTRVAWMGARYVVRLDGC